MIETLTPIEILKSLGLLSWSTLAVGWERGWVIKANLGDYATEQLQCETSDADLGPMATLSSANHLNEADIDKPLKQLADSATEGDQTALDKWRLAMLIALQSKQLDWDEKVTRLEELGAEFGYPPDMHLCSRYVSND